MWIKSSNITYVSCYFTPNEQNADFTAKLDGLEDVIQDMHGDLIVTGDFNGKVVEWGMTVQDPRGRLVMDMVSRLGLVIMNSGPTTTFRRPGYRETIIDISLASEHLASRIHNLRVIEDYTASDHQYIMFHIAENIERRNTNHERPVRWYVNKLDKDKLSEAVSEGKRKLVRLLRGPVNGKPLKNWQKP